MEYNGYNIVGDGTFGYKHIKPLGKGSVSLELRGIYTTAYEAQKAIDDYVRTKLEKASGNSKSTNGS
tara:strand:- start:11734 stop:11934 length:201 start_codon:yes stop_codon:yes gene_type:complete